MDKIIKVLNLMKQSKDTVILSGAGVSTLSGIPDFRGENGLYSETSNEDILSKEYFFNNTKDFFQFYFNNIVIDDTKPNLTHKTIDSLLDNGIIHTIITQNIDNLHKKNDRLIDVHGNISDNYCLGCNTHYNLNEIKKLRDFEGIPRCPKCNLIIKPDITLYGETLNHEKLMDAIYAIKECDLLIVTGTSLSAFPVCDIVEWFQGDAIIIINKTYTEKDSIADILIHDDLNDVFNILYKELGFAQFNN